ncbi:unnamed protein product [Phytophthora lilii]|uniref:Unnamed protein product n=1 Tax=Phytophthora lilii TaxID=2077276 RepID=A0A9W6WVN0_9STRA|nr:unnamed protein product [Phytophthora lilii]
MSETVKVIGDDEEAFTGVRPALQRRHTLAGNSSPASDLAHAPVVWRAVMPTGRRSTLVSRSDDVNELRSTIDGSMRTKRSISDATSLSHHRSGDKAAFALHDVDAYSVQRAKVLRRISEKRYARFRNFFKSYEPEMAREIQARSAFSREHLNAWVNYIVSPKVLRCIIRSKDTQQELLDLLMVSAAISKYGESELMAKDRRGDLSALQNIKLHTYDEYSPSRQPKEPASSGGSNTVAMEFVVRINERLSEERRVGGVVLREILTHASTMQVSEDKSIQISGLTKEEDRLKQIVLRVQSDWFQDAILKANGRYLYDAIRQILSNVDSSLWDEAKDKHELRRVNVRKSDRLGAEVKQIEKKSASERQIRPSMPPPPLPPRPEVATRGASSTSDAPLVPSPINASAKVNFTVYSRSSSMPSDENQERESTLVVGTDKTRRKLLPLGTIPRISRPRGLPPKRPQRKENDPIVHAPSAFIDKAQEQE